VLRFCCCCCCGDFFLYGLFAVDFVSFSEYFKGGFLDDVLLFVWKCHVWARFSFLMIVDTGFSLRKGFVVGWGLAMTFFSRVFRVFFNFPGFGVVLIAQSALKLLCVMQVSDSLYRVTQI
jgi:hypothetical protein